MLVRCCLFISHQLDRLKLFTIRSSKPVNFLTTLIISMLGVFSLSLFLYLLLLLSDHHIVNHALVFFLQFHTDSPYFLFAMSSSTGSPPFSGYHFHAFPFTDTHTHSLSPFLLLCIYPCPGYLNEVSIFIFINLSFVSK